MYVLAVLAAIVAGGVPAMETPVCRPAATSETTIVGLGMTNYAARAKGRVQRLEGVILDPLDKPIANALVEVYDHPEQNSAYGLVQRSGKQTRIAACWTGSDGRYRFEGLPAGHYDLRTSSDGFNFGIYWVFHDSKRRGLKRFDVHLNVWD